MTKQFCILLILGLVFSAPAFAAEGVPFTLTDAVNQGISTSPEYSIAAHQKNAQGERLRQARALYFPSVDLAAQTGRERISAPNLARTETLWQKRGSLTLTQLLFDGWGAMQEVRTQRYRTESAAHRVSEVKEFLGLDIVQAYLDILRQRELLEIAQANVSNHRKIHGKIGAGVDAGTATRGDAAQVEGRLRNAAANVSSVEQGLRNAENLFIEKVGKIPDNLVFPAIPRDKLPATVERAIQDALANSPTLAVYQSDIHSAEAERSGTIAALYPKVDFEVNGSKGENVSGLSGGQDNVSALVVMRWNLFRGGADMARRREFTYRYAEAQARAAFAERQVESDVRDTWAAKISAAQRSEDFLRQLKASEKVVRTYMDQFTMNKRGLLDVLDAENELFASRSNHINAVYTEQFAVFRLLALQGKMLAALGVKPSREIQQEVH